ncbi:MAG: hypothetical protein P0116_11315 [Candidatus Nitrosocosmicus sp.]|nr:hypothetical protein [Candidatus Nitrosocosmicus sp.]
MAFLEDFTKEMGQKFGQNPYRSKTIPLIKTLTSINNQTLEQEAKYHKNNLFPKRPTNGQNEYNYQSDVNYESNVSGSSIPIPGIIASSK